MEITIRIAETDVDYSKWNKSVVEAGCGSFYITTSWLNAYTSFGMSTQYLLAENIEGELVGGAPVVIYRIGPLSWIYVPHGPFAINNDSQVVDSLLNGIEEQSRRIRAAFIQVDPFERAPFDIRWQAYAERHSLRYSPDLPRFATNRISEKLHQRGYTQKRLFELLGAPQCGQIVDLTVDDLLGTFRKRTAQYIRRTQDNEQLSVRRVSTIDELHQAYEIIRENTERYGGIYRPWEAFESAVWPGIQEKYMMVMLAFLSDELVSALLVGFGGNMGAYISGGTRRGIDFEGLRPAQVLHYLAMQETRKRGFSEYDLTAVVGGGVSQLKQGFRPTYYRLQESFSIIRQPILFKVYQLVNSQLLSNRQQMQQLAKLIHAGKSIRRQ
jgi:lipid II:glycine glycyltransferase (peptidoglycan interpeptide bridge formation enzyme)